MIEVEIKFVQKEKKNFSFIIVRLLRGLIRFRLNFEVERDKETILKVHIRKTDKALIRTEEPKEIFDYLRKSMEKSRKYLSSLQYIRSKIIIKNFSLLSRIGIEGDAGLTALLSGGIMAAVNGALDMFSWHHACIHRNVVVIPDYERSTLDIDLDCIINLRIGHIIIAGYKIAEQKIRKR